MTISPQSIKSYGMVALDTWLTCGKCATSFGLLSLAIKSYEQGLFHDPTSLLCLTGLSYCLRLNDINVNETIGSQKSIDLLNHAINLNSKLNQSSIIYKELAECYLLIGLNDQAHQSIQQALTLSPQYPSLWLLSAQTFIRAGARNQAQQALNHCLELLPSDLKKVDLENDFVETARAAHAELAAIAAADGNIQLSIQELTATLSLPPPPLTRIDEHIALWCALSTAKERDNDVQGAIQACEMAEQAVGNSPRILMTHAYLLLLLINLENSNEENLNHCKAAIEILSSFIDLDLEKNVVNDGDFLPWYLLGKAYSLSDQPRLAYDSYQIALRNASNSPITWLAVGKLYLELKQLPDALEAYSHALRLQMDEGSPGTATAWDGLSCVYERCDDQLSDASDACTRSAACFKSLGDFKQAEIFEKRAEMLLKASEKNGPIPPLRDPPDVPPFLLRDLVALLPSERIAFIQGQKGDSQSQQKQQQQQQQQQQQLQQQQQQRAQQQHQDQQAHALAQAQAQHGSPMNHHNQQVHHTPQQQVQHAPAHGPVPPQMYPMPPNYKDKSPTQGPPLPLPPQWSQGPPPPNGPPASNGGPPHQNGGQPNPYYYQSGPPPPPNGPGGPVYRSPMNQPMVPNGHFQGQQPPPPPPGYYGYPMHPYPQPMYR